MLIAALIAMSMPTGDTAERPVSHNFDPGLIPIFVATWKHVTDPSPLAAKGLPRLTFAEMHDILPTRRRFASDVAAEQAIAAALIDGGYGEPTDAWQVTCRGSICEMLYVDRRPPLPVGRIEEPTNRRSSPGYLAQVACRPFGDGGGGSADARPFGVRAAVSRFCIIRADRPEARR